MTLVNLLADDLLAWLEVSPDRVTRRVVLWPDPAAQFARLAAYLEPALIARNARLMSHGTGEDGGQLTLKLALLRLESDFGAKAVVYLPGFGADALRGDLQNGHRSTWRARRSRKTPVSTRVTDGRLICEPCSSTETTSR